MKSLNLFLNIIAPIVIGGFIYLTFRTEDLLMFKWFYFLGLEDSIQYFRQNFNHLEPVIPDWFIYSLPTCLWVYSLTNCMIFIWKGKLTLISMLWVTSGVILAITGEVSQIIDLIPGTFDLIDLISIIITSGFILLNIRRVELYAK
ncbi:MAG: hypothetical protein JKY33_07845 [Bacteroidia bacterium]|nr:hypothetical protein [Bacteroidia bacterium]